jgi:hypothetical protein
MKSLFSAKTFAVAALALGAVGLASAAHARSDVILSIGVNAPLGYVQPAPVYYEPQPVYVQPRTAYVQPQTVYYGNSYGNEYRNEYRNDYGNRGRWERNAAWADWDHDGIPNKFDRHPRRFDPRGYSQTGWDRDHDGVPNRYDNAPNNPYRR